MEIKSTYKIFWFACGQINYFWCVRFYLIIAILKCIKSNEWKHIAKVGDRLERFFKRLWEFKVFHIYILFMNINRIFG